MRPVAVLVRAGAFIPIKARKRRASTIKTDLALARSCKRVSSSLNLSLPSRRRSPSLGPGPRPGWADLPG